MFFECFLFLFDVLLVGVVVFDFLVGVVVVNLVVMVFLGFDMVGCYWGDVVCVCFEFILMVGEW